MVLDEPLQFAFFDLRRGQADFFLARCHAGDTDVGEALMRGGRTTPSVGYFCTRATMRIVLVIGVALGGALLASCSSTGAFIGDNLPQWAGGLPKGAPPRSGEPGYDEYLRNVRGGDRPTTAPPTDAQQNTSPHSAAQPSSPARPPRQPVDDPIH
jgi:hypothetical protein